MKLKGIISIILLRTKVLLLEPLYFLRGSYFIRKISGRTIDLDEDRDEQNNIELELEGE